VSPPGGAVYLVEGDDPTLVGDAVRVLVDDLLDGAERTLALEDFSGDEVEPSAVAQACRTAPFLAERRVVVLRDVGRFTTEELAPLLGYLDDQVATTSLVLAAGGGRLAPKLVAAAKAHGQVCSTSVGRDSRRWVHDRLERSGLRLDASAETLVEAHLGSDLSRLPGLVDVLVSAHGTGSRLGADDVAPYLGEAGGVAPWDLTDAIDSGSSEMAISALHRLLGAGQRHPLVVLSVLARHFGNLLAVDGPSITTEAAAADALGIAKGRSTFPAKKALASLRRYGGSGVAQAVGLLSDAEIELKGATELPGELVIEILVARLCFLARAGGARRR
jgi:DNA polymerase-3 subunit delta